MNELEAFLPPKMKEAVCEYCDVVKFKVRKIRLDSLVSILISNQTTLTSLRGASSGDTDGCRIMDTRLDEACRAEMQPQDFAA